MRVCCVFFVHNFCFRCLLLHSYHNEAIALQYQRQDFLFRNAGSIEVDIQTRGWVRLQIIRARLYADGTGGLSRDMSHV